MRTIVGGDWYLVNAVMEEMMVGRFDYWMDIEKGMSVSEGVRVRGERTSGWSGRDTSTSCMQRIWPSLLLPARFVGSTSNFAICADADLSAIFLIQFRQQMMEVACEVL